ncbi:DUF3846 domain-containing protein [Arthrobacter crystallopoietes]|uniref:DUF3846 domain-containing protein n=1 Tax=Crystallibacter crystallopoietes TaxID=37928 RepID=A0A1H0XKV3_9MICC|nr:DUF3846 domain-containing protein [Arthrobacter crystallopoietes]SDQ03492.1 protein of unknown function [Arthrobacter crystallopoietes]
MSTCTALIIPADLNDRARVETIDAGLGTLQTLVAGNIEAVSGDDWHFYLNEEGKILHLAPNCRAAMLVLEETGVLADVYCGNVVFLGETGDGDEADVPGRLIDLAQQLFGLHQAA